MARIRTIKPDFWKSEKVARLTGPDGRAARLLFIALWNFCDDVGVMRGAPAYVRSEVYPYDEDVTAVDVARWLEMLERGCFLVRYQRNGSAYLWIRGFTEHQVINRPSKSSLPAPSAQEKNDATSPHGPLTEPSAREVEGKGSGREVESASQALTAPPLTLAVQEAPPEKPKRAPNTGALGEFIDWARAESKPRLPADAVDPAAGMKQHERVRLGEAVKLHGLEALKAAFRLYMGWQVAQEKGYSVGFFSAQWETWVRQVKAPKVAKPAGDVGRGTQDESSECAGCGEVVPYAATVGPEGAAVRLGAACGCWSAWEKSGVGFMTAAQWARERRARAA